MNKQKNGTNIYKAVCAVIFIIFCCVYLYYYQSDVLAAAQHIASGGKTHYEPLLGTILIVLTLKVLQNGIQAIARLKSVFFALTYFPSFLLLTFITDIPSRQADSIEFGAWAWVLPFVLLVWAFLVYLAKQYQQVEIGARGGRLFSQTTGINVTLILVMMLMPCLIGNHNRIFHQHMHVENLISRKEYKLAQKAAEGFNTNDATNAMLRACALAEERTIGAELFKVPMNNIKTIIPSANGTSTVILPQHLLQEAYKRNADWQLCEMLVRKDLRAFHDNLIYFYNLESSIPVSDSTANKNTTSKEAKKMNSYKDSLMTIRYKKLPIHYHEALALYTYLNNNSSAQQKDKTPKQKYLNEEIQDAFYKFLNSNQVERKKHFRGTYWMFFYD